MYGVRAVDVPRRPIAALEELIGLDRTTRLLSTAAQFRRGAVGSVIWNISSTAAGGGVADMLQNLIGYTKDLAIDSRWLVIGGDNEFFHITKRLHNRIHGQLGDGGELGPEQFEHIEKVTSANVDSLQDRIRPGDIVLLHDPQTAGLTGPLVRRGARVVWRSHIGIDHENELSRSAWEFLWPLLVEAHAYVFTRPTYVPSVIPRSGVRIIPPSIDPFSPKNQMMDAKMVRAALIRLGLFAGDAPACRYTRRDGSPGELNQPASVAAQALPEPDEPLVVQVSRWDRLKGMLGVMRGFAEHVAPAGPGWLVLAGPSVEGVADDPEGAVVLAQVLAEWQNLPAAIRSRVVVLTLPMNDVDDNAAMVNALQRHAAVITQKSLAEGFGLTVAEGMWKGRPVVGSAVGGIQDQITEGTGVLLADPSDLPGFGRAVRGLLDDPALANQMGARAHEHVRAEFVGDLHLLRYAELFGALLSGERRPVSPAPTDAQPEGVRPATR
ncbi:MAG: glycosyltransferase [Micromonosporaceae bacterium]